MEALLSLQNRWEIFNIEDEGGLDSKSPITEHSEMKSITLAGEEEEDETSTWHVDNARSRRTRKMRVRRKVCLPAEADLPAPIMVLPYDVLSLIFRKLKPLEILSGAQWVCSSWRKASKEPYLFRCIDLRNSWKSSQTDRFIKMVMTAVDQSFGELHEFSIADYYGEDLLNYVLDKSSSIKCLRFVKCYGLEDDLLLKFVKKISDLEELELSYCRISVESIAEVGRLCSNLTCFRWVGNQYDCSENEDAYVIAKNMPKLRLLQLTSGLSDDGLQAILNGCSNLEYLDLRRCYKINQNGQIWQKCVGKISHLRHPSESVDDWDYALKRCREYIHSSCACGYCSASFFNYDPDVEEKYWAEVNYDFDDEEDFGNQIFLPPKSVTCYL